MKWIVLALAVIAGLWVLFNSNLLGRRKTRADFEHAVRSLLVLMSDGGRLVVRDRGSPKQVELVREGNAESSVNVALRVPLAPWSSECEPALRQLGDSHGFDVRFFGDSSQDVLCEIRSTVVDIWSPAVGAAPARLLSLVLDSLSIPKDARFDLALIGSRSNRLVKREKDLRKSDD